MQRHAGQWKPGQSGNPAGRPKGSGYGVSIKRLMAKELEAEVELSTGKKIKLVEAIVKKLAQMAAEGDFRAIQLMAHYLDGKPVPSDRHAKDSGKPIKVVFGEDDAGL